MIHYLYFLKKNVRTFQRRIYIKSLSKNLNQILIRKKRKINQIKSINLQICKLKVRKYQYIKPINQEYIFFVLNFILIVKK